MSQDTTPHFRRTLITAALPYANGPVHIGHLAGVYVPADIYARYLRLRGREVLYVCGSDEHGVPITLQAKKRGISPQEVVDRYHALIKKSFEDFGISFDIYSRTTSRVHEETASAFFRKLYDEGKFVEQTTEQYYDEEAGEFLADRYIVGTCPRCGYDRAYGDQCERCGSELSPDELIDPHSKLSGATPVKRPTTHWYLPLNEYEEWLSEWILEGHKEWRPNVYGQCKSWLDMGLKPRAVSRDLSWGIPVPVEGAEGKVLYVWFDAPIGYISNTRELLPDSWETWWKDPSTRLIHFIGKDNIVFHCIVFPSMLKAEGSFILPDNVPANEFLNLEGDKISTSRNWAVWLNEYLEDFPGKQDVLRYVLTANAPETKDNDFTWEDFKARNNSELVAILGNFVNRAMVLTSKHFDGRVPAAHFTDEDRAVLDRMTDIRDEVTRLLEGFHFRDAQREAMELPRLGNKYLADLEPWKVVKTDPARTGTILNTALQIAANCALLLEPFLPFSMAKLRRMLALDGEVKWDAIGRRDLLEEGHALGETELLFEKIEDEAIEAQKEKLRAARAASEEEARTAPAVDPIDEEVPFDRFEQLDIRVATVLECEKVKKSKKLLRFKLDDGLGGRQILSGLAACYDHPEELVGRQVLFLANIAPRKMMGLESRGMILSALEPDGTLSVATTSKSVRPGSRVS